MKINCNDKDINKLVQKYEEEWYNTYTSLFAELNKKLEKEKNN